MEEHPIPQEVSTYEFRLVGDMTIKQFMEVAAGALIALVLYSSGMPPYVKWPLIVISFLSGIALAFFPIEDRPLSKWIILFMKAIYSPTVYVWDKAARKYEFFQPENVSVPQTAGTTPASAGAPAQGNQNQQAPAPTPATPASSNSEAGLEKKEQEFLSKVTTQFNSTTPITQTAGAVAQPGVNTTPQPQQQKKMVVPKTQKTKVEHQKKPQDMTQSPKVQNTVNVGQKVTPMQKQDITGAKAATFSSEASPPSPPTKPNVVVGQVLSSDGKIIDSAILEIRDSEGRPVRALRSNRLGHFMIVTPLTNGKYKITTEKDGHTFDPISFEAKDQIIPPIAIWAKT